MNFCKIRDKLQEKFQFCKCLKHFGSCKKKNMKMYNNQGFIFELSSLRQSIRANLREKICDFKDKVIILWE